MRIWKSIVAFFDRLWNGTDDTWDQHPWTDDEMERRVAELLLRAGFDRDTF